MLSLFLEGYRSPEYATVFISAIRENHMPVFPEPRPQTISPCFPTFSPFSSLRSTSFSYLRAASRESRGFSASLYPKRSLKISAHSEYPDKDRISSKLSCVNFLFSFPVQRRR